MKTSIILKDVHLYAYHGALPQERVVGSSYLLNLEVGVNFSAAMLTDRLAGTVNYALIYDVVKQTMQTPSQLVEHAAARICKTLFTHFPSIEYLHLQLLKENPPVVGCDCAGMGVSIYVTREEMQ
ncbi:MAG: dihydroneopterin aldolase [Bacteroidaceae bacterium]|nr:dihydroneopterin aldolase [Bacteroidaceae bacterium]